jgi:hypothetical protein
MCVMFHVEHNDDLYKCSTWNILCWRKCTYKVRICMKRSRSAKMGKSHSSHVFYQFGHSS